MVVDGKESRLAYQAQDYRNTAEFISQNTEAHRRIEATVGTLISRPEFETKLAEIKLELKQLDQKLEDIRIRVTSIEVEVRNLKGKNDKTAKFQSIFHNTNSIASSLR